MNSSRTKLSWLGNGAAGGEVDDRVDDMEMRGPRAFLVLHDGPGSVGGDAVLLFDCGESPNEFGLGEGVVGRNDDVDEGALHPQIGAGDAGHQAQRGVEVMGATEQVCPDVHGFVRVRPQQVRFEAASAAKARFHDHGLRPAPIASRKAIRAA